MLTKLSEDRARAVWRILVEHCGARPDTSAEQAFVGLATAGWREYRFGGSLGFGGKLYSEHGGDRIWVGCYIEDDTAERTRAMKAANKALDDLVASWS